MSTVGAFPVAELASEQASYAGSREAQVVQVLATLGRWLSRPICWYIEGKARKIANGAIWFQGALVQLPDEVSSLGVDVEARLLVKLQQAEENLLKLRGVVLTSIRDFDELRLAADNPLRASYAHLLIACTDAFESLQAFRWAVMEQGADNDIAAGKVESFNSVGDLLESLKS